MSLLRALHAEVLKLKRTLAFRVIFVLPLLIALLQFLVILRTKTYARGFNLWQTHPTPDLGRVYDAATDRPRDGAAQRYRA